MEPLIADIESSTFITPDVKRFVLTRPTGLKFKVRSNGCGTIAMAGPRQMAAFQVYLVDHIAQHRIDG
ncbi:MAG: hypothetical protein IPF95_18430 [Flavobacteriales bacterium]|nr:hypothetical protein [Flavobacteriales bacterium]